VPDGNCDPLDFNPDNADNVGTVQDTPTVWTAEQIADADRLLDGASPQAVLRWAVAEFHPRLLMATAFGAEGCVLIHMLSEIEPSTSIINIDTGYQFAETLAVRDAIHQKYGIAVEYIRPESTVAEYEAEHGGPLYGHRPDQCCHDRKVLPLRRAVDKFAPRAWISAIRKDQTQSRAAAGIVEWDRKFNLLKINPLLHWSKRDVWGFIVKNHVPYNKLHDAGYPSIGCQPCTRAVQAGEDDRAGRWAGKVKKECGLHVVEFEQGGGI
jgi:phosphoadenosine phosphosulfate reductase